MIVLVARDRRNGGRDRCTLFRGASWKSRREGASGTAREASFSSASHSPPAAGVAGLLGICRQTAAGLATGADALRRAQRAHGKQNRHRCIVVTKVVQECAEARAEISCRTGRRRGDNVMAAHRRNIQRHGNGIADRRVALLARENDGRRSVLGVTTEPGDNVTITGSKSTWSTCCRSRSVLGSRAL